MDTIAVNSKYNQAMSEQNNTIKAIIVDDEQEGIHALEFMLKQNCPQVEVLKTFQASVDALKGIRALEPDLLFLDIKMPNINGLELLLSLIHI